MRRRLFPAQAVGLILVLGGTLWLLARRMPGDRAAFFGSLAIFLLTLLGSSLYAFEVVESDRTMDELDVEEYNRYLRTRWMPPLRAKVLPYRYAFMVLSGLWIGMMAQHPWMIGACALLAEIAVGGATDSLPRFRLYGTAWVIGRLIVGIMFGLFLREWLLH